MPKFQPDDSPTVVPRMFTKDVEGLVDFLKLVFFARGETRAGTPSEMRIGDSVIMVSDGGGVRDAWPAFLYVYVDDADAAYRRALDAGATTIEEPAEMPYGQRRATVRDRWGNVWQIATAQ